MSAGCRLSWDPCMCRSNRLVISPVHLSRANLIISAARKHREVEIKLFFLPMHIQAFTLI